MTKTVFSKDVFEFLVLLDKYKVQYLIVGGEAVIYYGHPRLTGDIDFFYGLNQENVNRLWSCLMEFWENDVPGIKSQSELLHAGTIIQFGVPPNRIDLLNQIEGVGFYDAWKDAVCETVVSGEKSIRIFYISLKLLIQNKESIGRHKDLDDLKYLKGRS